MAVTNLNAGNQLVIPANTVARSIHVYVQGGGNAAYQVQVGAGPVWNYNRPAGDTQTIAVNNQQAIVTNAGPGRIQVLYT